MKNPIVIILIVLICSFIGLFTYLYNRESKLEKTCISRGGHLIKDRGNFTCIKKEVLIGLE